MDIRRGHELLLYGTVGADLWGEGFTAIDVVNALAELRGKDVSVRINSGGGYVNEGVAIYNALRGHDANVTVYVDGIAASSASVIAMAGKEVIMRKGATMMVHEPWAVTMGSKDEHEKAVKRLEADADSLASIYSKRTKRDKTECRADMTGETWLTSDTAVSLGYADKTDDEDSIAVMAFDYRVYAKAPENLRVLAASNGWTMPRQPHAALAAQPKEKTMTEKPINTPSPEAIAAAAKEATDRALAITEACASAGEPSMAAALIREGVTLDQAKVRVSSAKDIRDAVTLASKGCTMIDPKIADGYIAAGASIEKVRADLFEKMAAAQAAAPTSSQFAPKPETSEADLMKKAVERVNARLKGTRNGYGTIAN